MLTQKQEIKIRIKLAKCKCSICKLATQLKISRPMLSEVINRKRNNFEIESILLNWLKEK